MELKQGTLLQNGKYTIEKVLGQGSFGITYLATMKTKVGGKLGNIETRISVAIKEFFMRDIDGREGSSVTYSSGNVFHDSYKEKFIKESEKLSRLDHPNIVKVLDSFEANNTYYYVMEYCEGGSLDDKIKRSRSFCEDEAIYYAKQIGLALDYMHSHKMLHLDLKPGNIMLRASGELVLIDFGLSKEYDKRGMPETSTTIGLGTKGYAPIEQANYSKGDKNDFPVTMDVYAMGATMYKMLTGSTPPEASQIFNMGFPKYELASKGISDDLIQTVEMAMSPRVNDRLQSVGGVLQMLNREATNNGGKSNFWQKSKPDPNPNQMWIILLLMVVLMTGIGCYFIFDFIKDRKILSDKRKYMELVDEGDRLMDSEQYNEAIVKYEEAQIYENRYSGKKYSYEFDQDAVGKKKYAQDIKKDSDEQKSPVDNNKKTKENYNGYEWVDLGLSVKWATCNVGADKPEDYGDYYAWGEISKKNDYYEGNSKTYGEAFGDICGKKSYDVAAAKWGGSWRLPTKAEFEELLNECKWQLTTKGGKRGYKVTAPNGNHIFLPAAGYCSGSSSYHAGGYGGYWSASPENRDDNNAYYLKFEIGSYGMDWEYRYYGQTVRPVAE